MSTGSIVVFARRKARNPEAATKSPNRARAPAVASRKFASNGTDGAIHRVAHMARPTARQTRGGGILFSSGRRVDGVISSVIEPILMLWRGETAAGRERCCGEDR